MTTLTQAPTRWDLNHPRQNPAAPASDLRKANIVCLGCGRQDNFSRQVNGKSLHSGKWLRIVTDARAAGVPTQALIQPGRREQWQQHTQNYWQYEAQVGQTMQATIQGPTPHGFQQENWLLPPGHGIALQQPWDQDYDQFLDPETEELFRDGYSTKAGRNNYVPESQAQKLEQSLRFLKVEGLELACHRQTNRNHPHGRIKGHFRKNRREYALWITHHETEGRYLIAPDPDLPLRLETAYLTVSLLPPLEGKCHKVITGLLSPELPPLRP